MAVRVGINGFGRIGRNIMRAALGDKNIDFVDQDHTYNVVLYRCPQTSAAQQQPTRTPSAR